MEPKKQLRKGLEGRPEWGMSDAEWKAEAKTLYAKTAKDGNEHIRFLNDSIKEVEGTKNKIKYISPLNDHISFHTHPNWDAPLSARDIISHLATPAEKVSAATSSKAIYMVHKTVDTTRLSKAAEKAFEREFKAETTRLVKVHKGPIIDTDSTDIILKAGKEMAKKYRLIYKVIKR